MEQREISKKTSFIIPMIKSIIYEVVEHRSSNLNLGSIFGGVFATCHAAHESGVCTCTFRE